MDKTKRGACAVIFVSRRNAHNAEGYEIAADAMAMEAARQPGYLGIDSVRDAEGEGITISYWESDAHALSWRDHAGHTAVRDQGRRDWYDRYQVIVADITRSYQWQR